MCEKIEKVSGPFAFQSSLQNSKEKMSKEDPRTFEKLITLGETLKKLSQDEDIEGLEKLLETEVKHLPYLKHSVEDAYLSALSLKYDTVMEFFLRNGLNLGEKPLDSSAYVLTKISKYTLSDPPVEALTLVLKYGCDPNYTDDNNYRTAMHVACKNGNFEFIKILADFGADVNAVDKKRMMPLNYVENKISGSSSGLFKKIKEFLVSRGAENSWRGANSDF